MKKYGSFSVKQINDFKIECNYFRSILTMLGFEYIKLPNINDPPYVYRYKKYIIVQIAPFLPIDVRTWEASYNLEIFDNFKDVLFSDRIKNIK